MACSSPFSALIKYLEGVSLALQPFYGAREGVEDFVEAFDGVVEGDDAAWAGQVANIAEDIATVEAGGIVAGDEVPHDDAVVAAHPQVLRPRHPAVGRTKEVGVEIFVGLLGVLLVFEETVAQAAYMIKGVVAQAVARRAHHLKLFGMLAYIVAHHEEGGVDVVMAQHIKHPRGDLGDGAIVEGEIYGALVGVHSPKSAGIKPAEEAGWLFYKHVWFF